MDWGGVLDILREGPLSVNEVMLLGRIEDRVAKVPMPIGSVALDWKVWCWPSSSSFQKATCKAVYEGLLYSQDWHLYLNRIWGVTWTLQRWSQSLMNVWQSKGGEKNRMFVIRVMLGFLPTGEKIAARHIGDGRCLGCQHPKETIKHIFWECPIIKNLLRQVTLWFHNSF